MRSFLSTMFYQSDSTTPGYRGAGPSPFGPLAGPMPRPPGPRPGIRTLIEGLKLRIVLAFNPAGGASKYHYIVTKDVKHGRLVRAAGQTLCRGGDTSKAFGTGGRGHRGFWGLDDVHNEDQVEHTPPRGFCTRCMRTAAALGAGPLPPRE